jgi:hypothetical protein
MEVVTDIFVATSPAIPQRDVFQVVSSTWDDHTHPSHSAACPLEAGNLDFYDSSLFFVPQASVMKITERSRTLPYCAQTTLFRDKHIQSVHIRH